MPKQPVKLPEPCDIDGLTGLDLGGFCPNCKHVAMAHAEDGECAPCQMLAVAQQFTDAIGQIIARTTTTTTKKAAPTWKPSRSKP